MEEDRYILTKRNEKATYQIGEVMSSKKETESILSFKLPTILKDELQEYCIFADRTQSQVLREAVVQYVRFAKTQYFEQPVR